jgi:hypothetical protein
VGVKCNSDFNLTIFKVGTIPIFQNGSNRTSSNYGIIPQPFTCSLFFRFLLRTVSSQAVLRIGEDFFSDPDSNLKSEVNFRFGSEMLSKGKRYKLTNFAVIWFEVLFRIRLKIRI